MQGGGRGRGRRGGFPEPRMGEGNVLAFGFDAGVLAVLSMFSDTQQQCSCSYFHSALLHRKHSLAGTLPCLDSPLLTCSLRAFLNSQIQSSSYSGTSMCRTARWGTRQRRGAQAWPGEGSPGSPHYRAVPRGAERLLPALCGHRSASAELPERRAPGRVLSIHSAVYDLQRVV